LPNIPRRLLVRLNSEEAAAAILKDAPKLRSSTIQHVAHSVYINPDLAPEAAKLAYEARKKRRELKQRRENNHCVIPGNDISQVSHVPSSDSNVLAMETDVVMQSGSLVANRQFGNDHGRQPVARSPSVSTTAAVIDLSLGSATSMQHTAESTGGNSGSGSLPPPPLPSPSPLPGRFSLPSDQTANATQITKSFRTDIASK